MTKTGSLARSLDGTQGSTSGNVYVGDVHVLLLCPDSYCPSCVRGRVPFVQQSVRPYVTNIVVAIDRLGY